jgi:ComF family protein
MLRHALDVILPPVTLDTGRACLSPGLSVESWSRISFLDCPACACCGAPFAYDLGRGVLCEICQQRRPPYDRARAACVYDDASRGLILRLKHGDQPELGRLFARWLSRAGAELLGEADLITPVPLHPQRLFGRRYNQAAEIARPLARLAGKPYAPELLARLKAGAGQGGRSGRGRRLNVKGAFVVPERARARIAGRHIALIDDVFTTGATVEACAKALRGAGAAKIDVLTIARVHDGHGTSI